MPAALSAISVCGTPCWASSQAVSRPWVARPGFRNPDMDRQAGIVGGIDRGEQSGAAIDRGQPAGVAVGHDVQRRAVAARHLAEAGPGRAGRWRRSARHPPRQSPQLRPRPQRRAVGGGVRSTSRDIRVSAQCRLTAVGRVFHSRSIACIQARIVGLLVQGDGQPVGGGGADQRRAAHLHGANGVRRFVERADARPVQHVRQAGLVDDVDAALRRAGRAG